MITVELIVRFIFALQKKSYIWTLSIFLGGGGVVTCAPSFEKTNPTILNIYTCTCY